MTSSAPIPIPVPPHLFGIRQPVKGAGAAEIVHPKLSPLIGTGAVLGGKPQWEEGGDEIEHSYLAMSAIESDEMTDSEEDDMGTIAGYCVEELLGTGAFARVFVGRHPYSWDKVAIKQVRQYE